MILNLSGANIKHQFFFTNSHYKTQNTGSTCIDEKIRKTITKTPLKAEYLKALKQITYSFEK